MHLRLRFFDEPRIEIDGVPADVSLRKTEAMLFYMAFEGPVSRERFKSLLWADKDDDQAANSLRNAIYVLRRIIPDNLTADRRSLSLADCSTDLDEIDGLTDPKRPIPRYLFNEFLEGYDLIGQEEFSAWLMSARGTVYRRISDALKARLQECYERELGEGVKECLEASLHFEPYDEDIALELIEAYVNDGLTTKAVAMYKSFCDRLKSDIGVVPSARTEEVFKRLVIRAGESPESSRPDEFFYGREDEMKRIVDPTLDASNETLVFFLHGEAGIGKTTLVEQSLKIIASENDLIFYPRQYPVGENYPYSSWNGIVSQLGAILEKRRISVPPRTLALLSGVFHDFMSGAQIAHTADVTLTSERTPALIGHALAALFDLIAAEHRSIIVMEDLHYYDSHSLILLKVFQCELQKPVTFFLTSRPEGVASLTESLYAVKSALPRRVLDIPVEALTRQSVIGICRAFLPPDLIKTRGEEYFMQKCEGVPLLLVEMIKILGDNPDADCSAGLKGVILSRLEELSGEIRDFVSTLSVFGQSCSVEDIAEVMGREPDEIADMVEFLLGKKLLREVCDKKGRFLIDFTHTNVRECVYGAIPGFKRRTLHSKIARTLEKYYAPETWNPTLSSSIRHHYTVSGEHDSVLRQHLREMSFHIALNHFLFPLVRDMVLKTCRVPFSSREDTEDKISQMSDLLREVNLTATADNELENRRLEASYLEIRGGYLVNWGLYREGLIFINRALDLVRRYGFDETHLYCLEHMGHHYLQTDNAERLLPVAQEILQVARKLGRQNHVGLALRFLGMAKLIERDYENAERVFWRSVQTFEELAVTGVRYTLNMLAPRCYIGEMRQWRGDTRIALEHFEYCVDTCVDAELFWGRSHFHAHAADAAIDLGDWELMDRHIEAGTLFFESCRGGYAGSILYSMKAISESRRGDLEGALESLKKADKLTAIGKKSWHAAQYMAKAWVARLMEKIPANQDSYLDSSAAKYAEQAAKLYGDLRAEHRAALIESEFISNR